MVQRYFFPICVTPAKKKGLTVSAVKKLLQYNNAKLERIFLSGLKQCLLKELISFTRPTGTVRESWNTCLGM